MFHIGIISYLFSDVKRNIDRIDAKSVRLLEGQSVTDN